MAPSPTAVAGLSWKELDIDTSLAGLRLYVESEAQKQIAWYHTKRQRKAAISTALRFTTILLFVLGGLVPVVKAMLAPAMLARLPFDFGQTGYLLLAIAAGCVAMDRFFGYSTGWIRYITTALALEKSLDEFRLEWARHIARLGGALPIGVELDRLILTCQTFSLAVRSLVEQETHAWVAEFESNLAQLERDLQSRVDEVKKEKAAG
ncbi:MAG TPA: SLATT domain-containing protein [Bryobacteraceae bacterium]|jgi:hypothetical protein|nr:SLATT domain-containing protein [Bryobacteraceae bacterium]